MTNFVFIDGADGIGKTTLCEKLYQSADYANSNPYASLPLVKTYHERVPSGSGALHFLRDTLKDNSFRCDEFARQLMHSCDNIKTYMAVANSMHVADMTSKSNEARYVFFDRGPLSNIVYSHATFRKAYSDNEQIYEYTKIISDINLNVIDELIWKKEISNVYYVVLLKSKPFRKESDGSYYEEAVKFESVNEQYMMQLKVMASKYNEFNDLHNQVKCIEIDLDALEGEGISDSEAVAKHVWSRIIGRD